MTGLWLDDVRPAPAGWTWAKTLAEAKKIVLDYLAEHGDVLPFASLDHDLGATPEMIEEFGLVARGQGIETGKDFVDWLIEEGQIPHHVAVHSWSPVGADNMLAALQAAGYTRGRYTPFMSAQHASWLEAVARHLPG